jgi:hypothetical protein
VFIVCDSRHTGRNSKAAAVQNGGPLGKVISLEVRSFTRFLCMGNVGSRYPSRQVEVCDRDVMFSQRVANWYRTFASGRDNVMNGNRGGRRNSATIEYNTRRVKEIIQTDTRVSLRLMASDLGLFCGTVQYTVVVTLQYRKVYVR